MEGQGRISPASSSSSTTAPRRRGDPEPEEMAACTGKSCQSCTGRAIADCVALTCCPCALLNLITLTFVKLPWAMARRCIRQTNRKRKGKLLEEERRRKCSCSMEVVDESRFRCGGAVVGEAEKVWWELYEMGHLGFGRVSFTGGTTSLPLPLPRKPQSPSPPLPNP